MAGKKLELIPLFKKKKKKSCTDKTSLHSANYCMHKHINNYHLILYFCVFFKKRRNLVHM